ncbi:hypothetical protein BDFG_00352 [Blastomyces dermatitidis ATCC 26199]|nr:hypothetical protein BDFG_00352 [Blastomyces dermatitidis ATCC 26199]
MTALPPLSDFPYLTREEFTAACRALVSKVATLLQHEDDLTTSLGWTSVRLETKEGEIVLIIQKQLDDPETTSLQHLKHVCDTLQEDGEKDDDNTAEIVGRDDGDDVDENDPEELIRQPRCSSKLQVEYNIMLSPTYQVPILYFFLHNINNNSSDISAKGPDSLLDVVYNCLVPAQHRSVLKDVGIMGGLSIGHHPLSGLPVYFVHPCNTPDALRDVAGNKEVVTTETYLLLWLGLVGNCVGLHVPSKLLIETRNREASSKLIQSFSGKKGGRAIKRTTEEHV